MVKHGVWDEVRQISDDEYELNDRYQEYDIDGQLFVVYSEAYSIWRIFEKDILQSSVDDRKEMTDHSEIQKFFKDVLMAVFDEKTDISS